MSRLLQEGDARECRVADMLREFGSTIKHGCLAIAPARPFASASASAPRESEELFRAAHRAGELAPRRPGVCSPRPRRATGSARLGDAACAYELRGGGVT
jgi:hypothetical protein